MTQRDSAPLAPDDPYARTAQTFPVLSETMARRIAAYGRSEPAEQGSFLFRRGDRSVDFFLVEQGSIAILDHDAKDGDRIVHHHQPRQFTGELDLFNDRKILVSGQAAADTRVIRVARPDFRRMIAAEPDIGEIIMRAFILRRVGLMRHRQGGVTLVGPAHAAATARIETFLTRNGYPHQTVDTEREADLPACLDAFGVDADALPVVLVDGGVLRNPSNADLADALGLTVGLDPDQVHDVAVVGAGPAGLAAAVYAASEGLSTLIIEGMAPGGQAGTSSKIENYLGFPTGISGQALAGRAQVQAQKFGARLAVSRSVSGIDCEARPYRLILDDGASVQARAIVIATGARYRKLDHLAGYDRFEGNGIHYAATAMEAGLCAGSEVVVIGGGNSAGQAAMFLSGHAAHVHILVRGRGLADTMSAYLIERIEACETVTLHPHSEMTALEGDSHLASVRWTQRHTGAETHKAVGALFVMIGAQPNTAWLEGCVSLDDKGFVQTQGDRLFETSQPGIFAVGDVRAGSVKRVASGVGEGSVVVSAVHGYLADTAD
ncbi:FAD-dependent oxidoreductase [Sphingomonas sp. BGYR3]|uniref:FAD-dependent oxidoreductase n=1 Tax=Sphingomonas sp. BGYR3 TaxID=2975483 RepID=UPI0021A582CD|nr:FAD-dependent oxidoreductase [Sphingomonas sp. BGYR3]MDG5488596.1 FAD-dependent oxidoreductase [Sphingomonas sp. BGYR3]